jgi:hypothetical protein
MTMDGAPVRRGPRTLASAHRPGGGLRPHVREGIEDFDRRLGFRRDAHDFRDGVDLNDQQALTSLAVGAGLPADRVAATLASDDYSADVDQSMATAQRLNISGVPFFIFNQRFAVSGAQPTEIMLKALDAASGAIDIQS